MATPVVSVSSAPTFGGLTGYKRPALGKPTQVPSNLPSFRGKSATPGGDVRAPAIQNSKNRNDRGTNVAIPYARLCPIDHSQDLGRVARGDVCFVSRFQVTAHHVNFSRQERVIGLDYLNKMLGNDRTKTPKGRKTSPMWSVGKTVLLDSDGHMADNWRAASALRDWTCDGIVMSNDEPHAHVSNGKNDVQQFNICVQGPTTVNNGFQDNNGNGVEAYPRAISERHGYGKQGAVAIGGVPYYQSFPMQMFDRKIMPLSTVYVGLVAISHTLDDDTRDELRRQSPMMPEPTKQALDNATEFFSFKFVCFSDRAAKYSGDEHKKDATGSSPFDPYCPASKADYAYMVGAWKIGRVMDTSASRRDVYSGGPVDTAQQLTVNVCLEWMDWRALRRVIGNDTIASGLSGSQFDDRILQWPTQYSSIEEGGEKEINVPYANKETAAAEREAYTSGTSTPPKKEPMVSDEDKKLKDKISTFPNKPTYEQIVDWLRELEMSLSSLITAIIYESERRPEIFDPKTLFGKDPPEIDDPPEEQEKYTDEARRVLGILLDNTKLSDLNNISAYKLAKVFGQKMPPFSDGVYNTIEAERRIQELTAQNSATEAGIRTVFPEKSISMSDYLSKQKDLPENMKLDNLGKSKDKTTAAKNGYRFLEVIFKMEPGSMLKLFEEYWMSTENNDDIVNTTESKTIPVSRLVELFTKPPPAEANPSSEDDRNEMADKLATSLDEDTFMTANVSKFADYVFGLSTNEFTKDQFITKLTKIDDDVDGDAVRMKILKFLGGFPKKPDFDNYFDLLSNDGQTVSREAFDSFVKDIYKKAKTRLNISSAPQADSTDIFDAIFGATPSSSASRRPERARGTVGGSAAVEDKSPSSGAPRSRVRRAREGR